MCKTIPSVILFFIFSVTLVCAIAENDYVHDTNVLPTISESSHLEGSYKSTIIVNPEIIGIFAEENSFNLELEISQKGIKGKFSDSQYILDITSENSLLDLPDLGVINIVPFDTTVICGHLTYINVTIKNRGVYTEVFKVTVYANATSIKQTDAYLIGGSSTTITFNWNTTDFPVGEYSIKAYVSHLPNEINTLDNSLVGGCVQVISLVHDISIVNTTTSKMGCLPFETVGEGQTMQVNATVENQGDFVETFNVTAYANSSEIGKQPLTLNSWENNTISFTWNTTGYAKGNYNITVEVAVVSGETALSDNSYIYGWVFVTLTGDVDGDRDVDIFDIVRITTIYQVSYPDPHWDPNADIIESGKIDIFDIVAACGHYGESW